MSYVRKTDRPTRRQRRAWKLLQEMGVFKQAGGKRGTQLRDEQGSDYFKELRAKRKTWPKEYRRNANEKDA